MKKSVIYSKFGIAMAIHGRKIRPETEREKKSSTQCIAMYALIKKKKLNFTVKIKLAAEKIHFSLVRLGKSLHIFFFVQLQKIIFWLCAMQNRIPKTISFVYACKVFSTFLFAA